MPKFDHAVKYNGVYYLAGADIPEKAADLPPVGASNTEAEKVSTPKPKAATKAARGRKKGDA